MVPAYPERRLVGALLAMALVGVACTEGTERAAPWGTPTPAATTSAPTSGPTGPSPGALPTSVTVQAPRRGSLLLRGTYPTFASRCVDADRPRLLARYPGDLEIERSDDGTLALTLTISFREYLEGIAEVPSSWPTAALEAQAIAARTYALARTGWDGQDLDTPICSTSACQVYRGIPVTPSPEIGRWYRAVRRTSGEVLLYQGRPAETLYFSTSNGQTYGNEDVFGSDPLPYLRPVTERDDGASPTSRWSARLRYRDLARFLGEAGEWPQGRAISRVVLADGQVVVVGQGTSREMSVGTFRDAVNAWAHCLEPRRYPQGSLPTTIPSRWLSLRSGATSVLVTGRGWGHGVGMVQWGAYGKARRGLSAEEILAFYYGGLRPERFPEPDRIVVEVASGLVSVRIRPSGVGATLDGEPIERHVTVSADDQGLRVDRG